MTTGARQVTYVTVLGQGKVETEEYLSKGMEVRQH